MKKVNELISYYLTSDKYYDESECQKFEDILISYENELAEKDSNYIQLKNRFDNLINSDSFHKLYKEDFDVADFCINCRDELFANEKCNTCGWDRIIKLKDNSDYEKLESKED